jgi:hypothetical protein
MIFGAFPQEFRSAVDVRTGQTPASMFLRDSPHFLNVQPPLSGCLVIFHAEIVSQNPGNIEALIRL